MTQESQNKENQLNTNQVDQSLLNALNESLLDIIYYISLYQRQEVIKYKTLDEMMTRARIDGNFRDAFLFAIQRITINKLNL